MDDGKYPDFVSTVRTSCACNSSQGSIAHVEGAHAWTSEVCLSIDRQYVSQIATATVLYATS